MKTTTFRSRRSVLIAGALLAPALLPAQQPTRTIFFRPQTAVDTTAPAAAEPASAVRPFEAATAPFVLDSARLSLAGRCLDVSTAGGQAAMGESGVSLLERVTITLPVGAPADTQTRVVLTRRGPYLLDGHVMIPTAVVRVRSPGPPVEAAIVSQFDVVSCADADVLPLQLPTVPESARPYAVAGGPEGTVVWVPGEALLPTLQHYVIVDLGSAAGVRPGDQVTVYDASDPEAVTAVATVLRTSSHSATAVIIDQSRARISPGARARITAKLP